MSPTTEDLPVAVIEIDLRPSQAARALDDPDAYQRIMQAGAFSNVQRRFARRLGVGRLDSTRVLVIDQTRNLAEHLPGIERIIAAESVRSVLCLLVGDPPAVDMDAADDKTLAEDLDDMDAADRYPAHDEVTGGERYADGMGNDHEGSGSAPDRSDPDVGSAEDTFLYTPFGSNDFRFPPDDEPRAPGQVALIKPSVLQAVLWVSDARGTVWEMNERGPAAVNAGGEDTEDSPALDALIAALLIPAVFDRVVEAVGEMLEGVAVPGLRMVVGRIDRKLLNQLQLGAARRLIDGASDDIDEDEPPDDLLTDSLALLLGRPRAARPQVLQPPAATNGWDDQGRTVGANLHSRISGCEEAARRALAAAEATRDARTVARGEIPASGAEERVRITGRMLRDLRESVGDELDRLGGQHELSGADRNRFAELGIDIREFDGPGTDATVTGLRELVEAGLRRGRTLVEVDRWLVSVQRRVLPAGSAGRRNELNAIFPDEYLARLVNARPLRVRVLAGRLLGPTLISCALAGVLPASLFWWLGVAGALVTAPVVGVAGWRIAPGKPDAWAFVGLAFAVGLVGAFLGTTLLAPRVDGFLPVAVAVALTACIVAVAVAVPVRMLWKAWEHTVARWVDSVGIRQAARRLRDLRELVEKVALDDWLLAHRRREASNIASALHDVMTGIIGEIGEYADHLSGIPEAARQASTPGVNTDVSDQYRRHGRELAALFRNDLVDVACAVLGHGIDELELDALETIADGIPEHTASTLRAYREHLDRRGVESPPPFGTPSDERRMLATAVWRECNEVTSLLRSRVTDTAIIQLAAGEHLRFLNPTPGQSVLVPFLPQASRPAADRAGPRPGATLASETTAAVEWTESGQVGGVLRLTPLIPGVVRSVLGVQP